MMRPPRLAVRLVSWRLGADGAEFVLGDLEEAFAARCRERGTWRARGWYWRQTALLLLPQASPEVRLPPGPRSSIGAIMGSIARNLRLAVRMAGRQPLFTATVTLTLALAIGASAVIFSMVDMLMLRPLPIAEPARVGWIFGVDETRGTDRADLPSADFLDFSSAAAFSHLAAISPSAYTLTGRGDARRLNAYQISPSLFDVWGMRVVHGRRLVEADARPGAAAVVLLTHGFWTREFAADPSIVGQTLTLSGTPHTIAGILGRELEYGDIVTTDVWTPYVVTPVSADRVDRRLTVLGLLAPGATIEQADAEVKAIAERLARENPASHAGWSARSIGAREGMTNSETWIILALLVLTVTMVLLIASANVTNMLLARMAGRRRELAVRGALGAGRAQIAGQLLAEGLVLAIIGGAAGLGFAYASVKLLAALAAGNFFFDTLEVNYRVAAFAMGLALVAPVFFALIPALQAAGPQAATSFSELGSRTTGGRRARRLRGALVVAQIALAMALMVTATLALRSIVALMNVDLGFRSDTIAAVRFEVPAWRYPADDDVRGAVERVLGAIGATPGVRHATVASAVPAIDADVMRPFHREGTALDARETQTAARVFAGADYFPALGIPVLAGRGIERADRHDSQPVAVVSRTTAQRYLGGIPAAIGRRIRVGDDGAWATVVGVAQDAANPDVDKPPNPVVYVPYSQQPQHAAVILVSSANPSALIASLRDAMRSVDRDIAIDVATFDALLRQEFAATRAIVALFIAFGGLAVVLAASGLYGVIAFVVAQRTREFGVRLALGAQPGDVRRLMMAQGGALIGAGLGLGLAGSIALAQLTRGILYGVRVSDPSTYIAILVIVGATALVAAYVPARRAMRVNPIEALRTE